jgi:hypothetical protein
LVESHFDSLHSYFTAFVTYRSYLLPRFRWGIQVAGLLRSTFSYVFPRDSSYHVQPDHTTSRSEEHIRKAIKTEEIRPLLYEIPVKTSGKGVIATISLDGTESQMLTIAVSCAFIYINPMDPTQPHHSSTTSTHPQFLILAPLQVTWGN